MMGKRYAYLSYNCAILQKNIFSNKACFAGKVRPAGRAFAVFKEG